MHENKKRLNCWEHTGCGREPGGKNAEEQGICQVATSRQYDGVNRGKAGGRFCWAIAGTYSLGVPKGTFVMKHSDCIDCSFFKEVQHQEDRFFIMTKSNINKKIDLN